MSDRNHSTYREWLDLEADAALSPTERAELTQHLDACGECRAELAALRGLHEVVARSRVPVRQGFRREILAALPTAPWEKPRWQRWSFAVGLVMVLVLAAGSGLVAGLGGAEPGASLLPIASAVIDSFTAATLAGAGLLAASWTGVGLAVQTVLGDSLANLALFAVLVVGLHLLLWRLLRRPGLAPAGQRRRGRAPNGEG